MAQPNIPKLEELIRLHKQIRIPLKEQVELEKQEKQRVELDKDFKFKR